MPMQRRISMNLWPCEQEALLTLALQERRDPREQAAVLSRKQLERRGLLPSEDAESVDTSAETPEE